MNMDTFYQIFWILVIASASVGLWMLFGGMTSDTDKKNRGNSSTETKKPKGVLSGWWTSHGDIIKSLGYVALALTVINVLCEKIGFEGWERVYEHEGFWWFNTSLLLTVLLVMVANKPVVKWFAGALVVIILIGVWRIGYADVVGKGITLEPGKWSRSIDVFEYAIHTYPAEVPVEYEIDGDPGKVIRMGGNSRQDAPKDAKSVRLRADKKIVYVLRR